MVSGKCQKQERAVPAAWQRLLRTVPFLVVYLQGLENTDCP